MKKLLAHAHVWWNQIIWRGKNNLVQNYIIIDITHRVSGGVRSGSDVVAGTKGASLFCFFIYFTVNWAHYGNLKRRALPRNRHRRNNGDG